RVPYSTIPGRWPPIKPAEPVPGHTYPGKSARRFGRGAEIEQEGRGARLLDHLLTGTHPLGIRSHERLLVLVPVAEDHPDPAMPLQPRQLVAVTGPVVAELGPESDGLRREWVVAGVKHERRHGPVIDVHAVAGLPPLADLFEYRGKLLVPHRPAEL